MQTPLSDDNMTPAGPAPRRRSIVLTLLRVLLLYVLPLAVVVGGIVAADWLIKTAPEARRRPAQRERSLVKVQKLERISTSAVVQAMGTVIASQEVRLMPQVGGRVIEISPRLQPGGRFAKGDFILQIEPRDYDLAIARARSQVTQAEYQLRLEQGHQEIARKEWDLLGLKEGASDLDLDLALRKPHLQAVTASRDAANAALAEAELARERTTVVAPFNCMVVEESVDPGTQLNPQSAIATLVGTDEYWVQVAVPVEELRWIRLPAEDGTRGSKVVIRQDVGAGSAHEWKGRTERLLGDLGPSGRMARVLVSVADPLNLQTGATGQLPLLLGSYVRVSIHGEPLENVVPVPRTALHGDGEIWVMDENDRLDIRRNVTIAWRGRDEVLVRSGVEAGERLVVSDMAAPVHGTGLAVHVESPGEHAPDVVAAEDPATLAPLKDAQRARAN